MTKNGKASLYAHITGNGKCAELSLKRKVNISLLGFEQKPYKRLE
ncbi:hypothetical protein [Formosa sediminum]